MPDLESMSLLTRWLFLVATVLVAVAIAEIVMHWRSR